LFVDSVLMSMA